MLKNLPLIFASLMLTSCASVDNKSEDTANALQGDEKPETCQPAAAENGGGKQKQAQKQGLDPDNIALLNWNIYKGNEEGWKQDLSSFARSHDVMTIQEAHLDEELSGVLETNNFGAYAPIRTAPHAMSMRPKGLKSPISKTYNHTTAKPPKIKGKENRKKKYTFNASL